MQNNSKFMIKLPLWLKMLVWSPVYIYFLHWIYKTFPENYKQFMAIMIRDMRWFWFIKWGQWRWSPENGPIGLLSIICGGLDCEPHWSGKPDIEPRERGREKINNRACRTSAQMLSCISMRQEKWRVFCKGLYRERERPKTSRHKQPVFTSERKQRCKRSCVVYQTITATAMLHHIRNNLKQCLCCSHERLNGSEASFSPAAP